ncbi:hypothetical protein M9Y10_013388 [Tritrichomonas musculus]|uniref:E3 ubiquitin protein ligase n=1 Tax=Tritrichomonas musculus TaxID=1915356 RepID=A0ABR2I7Q0_9EUKA
MNDQSPLSSFNIINDEPQVHKEIEEPGKMPQDEKEQFSKLNDLIQHMEFNIEQNRKRCDTSSLSCYTLLRSTELLAFDIMFANYLLGDANPSDIYDFFEHCTIPQFDLSSGQISGFEKAREHIQYLQSIIENCSKSFLSLDLKQKSIPKRVSEFALYLKDQKVRLDHQLKRNIEAEKKKIEEENQKKDDENEEVDLSGLPPSFTKWLTSELKVGLSPDQESIEIHCLFKSITNRLKSITELYNTVAELELDQEEIKNGNSNEISNEKIENSPYVIGAKKNCQCLRFLLSNLIRQKMLFKQLNDQFTYCKDRLSDLTQTAQRSIEEMTTQMDKLRDILSKKQAEVSTIEQELQPFIALFYTQTRFPQLSPPPHQSYQKLEETLNIMIAQNSGNAANNEVLSKLQLDKNNLYELKGLRAELCDHKIELNQLLSQIEEKDRAILEMAIEHSKVEEEFKLQEQEAEQLKKYEAGLNEVQQLLRFDEMQEWCQNLLNIIKKLETIAQNQETTINNVKAQTDVKQMKMIVDKKSKEIDKLSETNYKMNTEIARSKIELEAVKEERYHANMELSLNKEFVPECITQNSKNEAAIKKYLKMVTCPVCKKNRRNVILATCRHPICNECAAAAKDKCPICGVMFNRSNIRPFFIQ